MNKEQLKPLLAERHRWLRSPTCPNGEWFWAQYLLNEYTLNRKQEPEYLTVYTTSGETYDAWTIVKDFKPSQPTRLVIDPFPGIIVNLENRLVRPLLDVPQFGKGFRVTLQSVFHHMFNVSSADELWYRKGMTRLMEKTVNFPIDYDELWSTMQVFEKYFHPKKS